MSLENLRNSFGFIIHREFGMLFRDILASNFLHELTMRYKLWYFLRKYTISCHLLDLRRNGIILIMRIIRMIVSLENQTPGPKLAILINWLIRQVKSSDKCIALNILLNDLCQIFTDTISRSSDFKFKHI